MLLTLDVGNSAVKGGLFDGTDLRRVFSVPLDAVDASAPEPAAAWGEALRPHLGDAAIDRIGLCSVVPATGNALATALSRDVDAALTVVRPTMTLPFELNYETPETLGADRLAAAAAGWRQYGATADPPRSVIVLDAGTAVTAEVVHREGVYEGGVITAGPDLVRRALRDGTAQLPEVPLALPDAPIGRSTQTALQSGIMWGLVDTIQGMAARHAEPLPDPPQIVLTGGWGPLLTDHLDGLDHHAPHLVLHGIRVLVAEQT
jgi:type III pantothenate kinase